MPLKEQTVWIKIRVDIPFWDALKLRIAGLNNLIKEGEQDSFEKMWGVSKKEALNRIRNKRKKTAKKKKSDYWKRGMKDRDMIMTR